jgi:hypothetical protein
VFAPLTIALHEAGPDDPYRWLMTDTLVWSGPFRGETRELRVTASAAHPFLTDLASVPRSLTWLFPRYGKYTKAAVLHDYLCQRFRETPSMGSAAPSLLPLGDRSDADEAFNVLMNELGVPRLRRGLMWTAVSWATLITSLVPGRRSKPVGRRVGRVIVLAALVAIVALLVARHDLAALVVGGLVVPAAVLAGGIVALGRGDRVRPYVFAYGLTLLFSPLLALGLGLGLALYLYLFLEDLFAGLPAIRGFFSDLFSNEAKVRKLGTPQFARVAAVIES